MGLVEPPFLPQIHSESRGNGVNQSINQSINYLNTMEFKRYRLWGRVSNLNYPKLPSKYMYN